MVLRCRYARKYGQLATARKGELGLLLRHTRLFRARAASGQTARTGPHLHRLRHGHGGFRAAGHRKPAAIMGCRGFRLRCIGRAVASYSDR